MHSAKPGAAECVHRSGNVKGHQVEDSKLTPNKRAQLKAWGLI
jgi:hypothetical protein